MATDVDDGAGDETPSQAGANSGAAFGRLRETQPEAFEELVRWLGAGLVKDQFARLNEGGLGADQRVPLAKVFVDLAANRDGADGGDPEPADPSLPLPPGIVARLLTVPPSAPPRRERATEEEPTRSRGPGARQRHWVLIAGPGQGKSTVVQYLSQLHRLALLRPWRDRLDERACAALDVLDELCKKQRLSEPKEACLPLFLPLSRLAAWLAREHPESRGIEQFITYHALDSSGIALSATTLDLALGQLPWLLVLDGLDEVPGATDRQRALDAVDTFLAARPGAHCIVVATTRPQSYSGEFGGLTAQTLCPMSMHRARTYARYLLAGRYSTDAERRRQIEERLDRASGEPATARLMRTPLQVTIMTALLAESARAPVERWRLFRDFYNVIVRRESDRDERVAEVLSKFRTHLDTVHERVALLLQVDAERDGGSDASLERERFIEVVEQRLTEEGFARDDAAEHARELARIAEDRLVFLTGVRAGRVGFELRSFQEFMAAEALFNGRESAVIERMRVIARSPAWTNVLLFMASRCMATASSLRDDFTIGLCKWLDDPAVDPTAASLHAGGQFALELLDEGALATSPALLRDVTLHALTLLELPPVEIVERLAATLARLCLDPDTKEQVGPLVMKSLEQRLPRNRPVDAQAAWIVALWLANEELPAVRALVDRAWPQSVEDERKLLEALTWRSDLSSRSVLDRLPDLAPRHPSRLWSTHVDKAHWCGPWGRSPDRPLIHSKLLGGEPSVDVVLRKLGGGEPLEVPEAYRSTPYWRVAAAASRFEAEPSTTRLADALDVLAEYADADLLQQLLNDDPFSWLLEACIRWSREPAGLKALAGQARAGELGDPADWLAAEVRWTKEGITESDLVDFIDHEGLPHIGMKGCGAAFGEPRPRRDGKTLTSGLTTLVHLRRRATTAPVQAFLGRLVLDWATGVYAAGEMLEDPLSTHDLAELAKQVDDQAGEHERLITINAVLALVGAGGDIAVRSALQWLSARPDSGMLPAELRPQPIVDTIRQALRESPGSRGLLRILGFLPIAMQPMAPVSEAELVLQANDDGEIEASILALEVHRGGFSSDRAASIGSGLAKLSISKHVPYNFVLDILGKRKDALTDGDVALVRTLLGESPHELIRARVDAFKLLEYHHDSLPTAIATPETWEALRLPPPAPLPLPPAITTPGSDRPTAADVPVHFHAIEIQGLRCYAALEMADLHHEPDRGQWIFVLGENGAGKTTLLRGLAMALVGREVGNLALGSSETVYRRPRTQRATVDVRRTPGATVYQASVEGENGHERFVVPSSPDTDRPFVVGYGCRRGSALGGPQRALDFSRLAAIRTLFDDPEAGLVHGEQWLVNLDHAAVTEKTSDDEELRDAVLDLLQELLPEIDRPTIDKRGVWVKGPVTGGVPVRLAAMSDGYLTSLGWVLDMMARWIKQKQDAGKKIAQPFHEGMTGVVLLDELDLHLHPRWQVRVVSDLKRLFPRMTFIVTTHNPMTLVGAHKREIWMLQRDPEGDMGARRADTDPRLRTGSELYARFFGLEELYPDDLGRKLRRYGFLASSPYRTDEEERDVHLLLAELQREGIDPGFAPAPREGS